VFSVTTQTSSDLLGADFDAGVLSMRPKPRGRRREYLRSYNIASSAVVEMGRYEKTREVSTIFTVRGKSANHLSSLVGAAPALHQCLGQKPRGSLPVGPVQRVSYSKSVRRSSPRHPVRLVWRPAQPVDGRLRPRRPCPAIVGSLSGRRLQDRDLGPAGRKDSSRLFLGSVDSERNTSSEVYR